MPRLRHYSRCYGFARPVYLGRMQHGTEPALPFVALTNGPSKKLDNLKGAAALHFAHYNLVRIHRTLRTMPAMATGVEASFGRCKNWSKKRASEDTVLSFEVLEDGQKVQIFCDQDGMEILQKALASLVKHGGHTHLMEPHLSVVTPFGDRAVGEVVIDYSPG